mgnify:CR=1 FL=1
MGKSIKLENGSEIVLPNEGMDLAKGINIDTLMVIDYLSQDNNYVIGMDLAKPNTKDISTYILSRKKDGVNEILLHRTNKDSKALEEEVRNLSKYFDAPIHEF